ncbi:class I SAM-dependent methyltransferase [Patescibacteria group bacterium AH-259-L05]|nr:class I SAM-dependent methyltransferase [Patescibacteria group bacterium AH-259-L05]
MKILSTIYNKYCPNFIKRTISSSEYDIRKFLISAAKDIGPNKTVLDAGAGQCQYKSIFNKQKYVAVDIAYGDDTWDYSKLDYVYDLENTPFSDNKFDSVICTQVLEHVKEPKKVLNEIFRILKPGGTIYISAPQGWGVHQAPHDYYRYTNFGLQHILQSTGFKVIYIKPSCGYFKYLANRLTVLPKTMFWQIKNRTVRVLFFPFELISYLLFVLIIPSILSSIDFIDKKRNYTLNYFVKAQKPTHTN